ncbi:MAG: MarR family winged helix-turn-helix transcriptional regulator, partial [Ktedonobacteraceae bacterium]
LDVNGGFSIIRLDLPAPSGMVLIRISGGASEITIHRPAGVAARINFKGWASKLVFDEQTFSVAGNIALLQSPDFGPTAPCYDIDVTSYANLLTITSG